MNIEIANRLVELRRAHGYSQEDLAAKLGVSRQAVSKWERAESSPDTDNLIALARLYGVSLDGLLLHETGDGGGFAVAAAPQPVEEPEEAPEPESEAEERARIFAAAAAWDEADEAAEKRKRSQRRRALEKFPYPLVVLLLYMALGVFFGWWHPGWLLFLTIPIYYGIAGEQ